MKKLAIAISAFVLIAAPAAHAQALIDGQVTKASTVSSP